MTVAGAREAGRAAAAERGGGTATRASDGGGSWRTDGAETYL